MKIALLLKRTALSFLLLCSVSLGFGQVNHLVISQVYGGGGNTGAPYTHDFIGLFNPTNAAISVNGWSVQYASATGTSWTVSNLTNVSIPAGKYYLVQLATGGATGSALPTPDATGSINMSGTAGKVALVSAITALTGSCPTGGAIVDFVGFGTTANCFEGTGPTPAPSNTTAVLRASNGCTDTNQNATNFSAGTPVPRNSATAANYCGPAALAVTLPTPNPPTAGVGFSITIEARDLGGSLKNVFTNTNFTLSNTGGGSIGGTTTGTIIAGNSSVVVSGITLSAAGSGVTITATRTTGDVLTAGTSATFNVQPSSGPSFSATNLTAFGSQCINGVYGPNSIVMSNSSLTTADIVITSDLAAYTFSTTAGGSYTASLTYTGHGGGSFSPTFWVRFSPLAATTYNGFITIAGGGATSITKATSGTGINTAPIITTGAASAITTNSATVAGTLNTAGICGTVTSYGIEYSTTNGFANGTGTAVPSTNLSGTAFSSALTGLSGCTVYYTHAYAIRSAGFGAAVYGTQGTFTTSNPAAPVATAGTAVGSSGFTANWGAVSGASSYRLDVYTKTPGALEDFTDGNFTSAPAWSGSTGNYAILTAGTLPGGLAATDGSYLGSNSNVGVSALTMASTETGQWQFSLGSPDYSPSSTNNFGVVLMSSAAITTIDGSFNGYYLRIGVNSSPDPIELWRSSGTTKVKVGDFPSSPSYSANALENGINVRVTRNGSGQFELFYATGFQFIALPTTSAGTLTDATHSASSYFGVYTDFSALSTSRRVFIDNIELGGVKTPVSGFNNLTVAGTSQAVTGLSPATEYFYVVRTQGASCTSANSNEITVTTDPIPDYYSRASGNVTDAIWSSTSGGAAGPAVWNVQSNMHIQSGHTVTNTADVDVKILDVQTGGTLVMNTGTTLNTYFDEVNLNGTVTAAAGSTLALKGLTLICTITTTGTPVLSNLLVDKIFGVLMSGNLDIKGQLDLLDGDFDATGGNVRLVSNATGTGSLGPVGASASYTGDLTVQRFIPAGATNWRLLGSPVDGMTVADWNDNFVTAGFPGSNWPGFDNPVGSNILWPSVREYNEGASGSADNGLVGVTNISTLLTAGKGFAAWCGTNLSTTAAFTIDVKGNPTVASSPIDLVVTYFTSGGVAEDGWNLVSNPVPSAIDFTSISLGANTYDGYYVYNPINGTTEVWDEFSQMSTGPNLNGNIASSQGFWLKATAASPANSTVTESAKVSGNGGGLFGGDQVPAFPIVRLNISSSINTFQDNALVVFDMGAPEFEPIDAPKMFFSDASAPMIATLASTGESMAFNKYGAITEGLAIPVKVATGIAGMYTITVGVSGSPFSCMWLEDTQNGTLTPLLDGATYSFQLAAGAQTGDPRFIIHSTSEVDFATQEGVCGAEGMAVVDLGNSTADVTWTTSGGTILLEQPNSTGEAIFSTDVAGNYTVRVSTNAVCGEMVQDFVIDVTGTAVVAAFSASANAIVNEPVVFTNNSTEYGEFFWDLGDNTTSTEVSPEHTYTMPGTYTVTLEVTADDCTVITTGEVVVSTSTSVATTAATGLTVWSNAQGIILDHVFTDGKVQVEVLDATGRVHIQRQVAASPGRVVMDSQSLSTGIWFVRVTNGSTIQSFRIPLVR